MFKEEIERLRLDKILKKFPNHTTEWANRIWFNSSIKYTKGRTASGIEKNIIEYIKLIGHHAEKHSVTGRLVEGKSIKTPMGMLQGKKKFIPSTSQKGSADITSTIYGISVKIEVKKGKDRMSEHQKKYALEIQGAGGFYFVAHEEEDFLMKFNELLTHPKIVLLSTM